MTIERNGEQIELTSEETKTIFNELLKKNIINETIATALYVLPDEISNRAKAELTTVEQCGRLADRILSEIVHGGLFDLAFDTAQAELIRMTR